MNVNQITIKKNMEEVYAGMLRYLPQINVYRESRKSAEQRFSSEFAEAEKRRALEQLKASAQATQEAFLRNLDNICGAAKNLEHQPVLDEIMPVLTLLGSSGDKLPDEMKREMLRPFIGNKQALIALRAAFENHNLSVLKSANSKEGSKDWFDSYIFDAQIKCDALRDKVYAVFYNPAESAFPLLDLWREIENFAKLEGVELAVNVEADEIAEQFLNERFRVASGLSAE